jgi:hypothetical protein
MKTPAERQEKKSAASHSASGWRKWPWLTTVGAVAMFASWILQNEFAAQSTEERLHLESTQLTIDVAQLRMEQWRILYMQEKAKASPDTKILLAAAFKTLQAELNLAAWSSARVREDESESEKDIQDKNEVQKKLTERYKSRDLEALETDLRESTAIENQFNLPDIWTESFGTKLARARQLEHTYTILFISTFALGSFVAAWDFIRRIRQAADPPH